MARKKIERTQQDVREYPSYSIDEAADYLGVPKRTLRSWVSGYSYRTRSGTRNALPIIQMADPNRRLLSFFNLVEAQVLASTRERQISVAESVAQWSLSEAKLVKIVHCLVAYSKRRDSKSLFKALQVQS